MWCMFPFLPHPGTVYVRVPNVVMHSIQYTNNQIVGQHSRICREGKAVIRHLIQTDEYKYSFIEKQIQRKLEVRVALTNHLMNKQIVCMHVASKD